MGIEEVSSIEAVELGGKARTIEYTLYAVDKLRKLTGKNLMEGDFISNDPEFLSRFVWAGLITHDETFDGLVLEEGKPSAELEKSLSQIGKWLTMKKLPTVVKTCERAFMAAIPQKKDDGSGNGAEKK